MQRLDQLATDVNKCYATKTRGGGGALTGLLIAYGANEK